MAKKILQSAAYACDGFRHAYGAERNLRLFALGYVLLLLLAAVLGVTPGEWIAIILSGGLFLVSELLNTALERFADAFDAHLSAAHGADASAAVRTVKDVAAAASLVSLCVVMLVVAIILVPRLVTACARVFP